MNSVPPAMRRALVLDPDIYSGEGLRLLCDELGYVAEVIRSPRLVPNGIGRGGSVALALIDARIAEDGDGIGPIAARVDTLLQRAAPIIVLGGSAHWSRSLPNRRPMIVEKPIAPGRLVEIVTALQSRR
ncbi:MAG: hypothetical protein JNK67_18130 [Alphaproteobacteria bacterium]|nr:hypothetical protein [Alphaproteobacteria bacterium]